MMLDISKSQLLTPSILEYLISYLEKVNLDDDSCIKNHHMITILYMFLYFFYGENGCNFLKGHENNLDKINTIIEIEKYLSDLDVSLQHKIEPIFLRTCEFLKNLLHHKKYRILNFKARDICQHFSIKLDPSLMIRLCIDGVRLDNEEIENLFMFIGNSGCGKSSTINYLYGIGYRLVCSKKTQKYYLKQVDENVLAPAKVGHGNVSETLYPKIIKKENLSFCDFPGFNDTRDEAYKTCASLGLPIAIHYAKNKSIWAIVVVIDWETITLLRGDELLKTIKTIHSLMNDLGSSSLKLLYAITRLPTPPDDQYRERDDDESSDLDDDAEYCDSQSLVEKVIEHLKLNINKLTNELNDLTLRTSNDIRQLLNKVSDLTACMKVFEKLGVGSFESHGHMSGWKMTFLKLIDTSGVVKKGSNVLVKQNIMKELKKDKSISSSDLVNERIEKFIDQIFKELESKSDQKEKIIEDLIEKETQKLDDEMEDCQKEIEKIKKKLEDKNVLIEFLKNIKTDDIYIIRGFKLNKKWEDHKEKLLERIQNICIKNDDQTDRVPLKIDGKSEQFSVVLEWTKEESKRCGTMLNDVIAGIQKIEDLKKNIDELDNDIQENEQSLRLALVSSRENENKTIESLKNTINSFNERKQNLEKELEKTSYSINEMNEEIRGIEESPAIEYGSKIIVKKRSKFKIFFRDSYAQYTFPKTYYEKTWSWTDWITGRKKHILPIDRVEFSCVVNKENKIVFKTPLINNQIDKDRIEIVKNIEEEPFFNHDNRISIIKENEPNFKRSGTILFITDKLDEGIFSIRVILHDQDVFFGVRCFVKPIHFPENKGKIEDLKNKIKEKGEEKIKQEKKLEYIINEIKEKTEHYECVVKGLYDEKKGEYILKFLINLDYSFEEFVDVLMQEIKEESGNKTDIEWLEKDENFKEIKKAFVHYDEMKKHFDQMPKNLLQDFIFSKNEELIKKEMEDLKKEKFEAVKFDFQRLLRLYKISSKSGLSFIVLREIVKSLKEQRGQVNKDARYLKRALNEEIEKLRKGLQSFKEKSELFEKRKWVIDVLKTVVEVLSYQDLVEYTEFRKAKESYDATDFKTVLESANNRINRDKQL